MNAIEFTYWLNGVFEGKSSLPPEQQLRMIQDHLKLVMTKVTLIIEPLGAGRGTTFTVPTIRPDTLTCDTKAIGGNLASPAITSGRIVSTAECKVWDPAPHSGPIISTDYKLC